MTQISGEIIGRAILTISSIFLIFSIFYNYIVNKKFYSYFYFSWLFTFAIIIFIRELFYNYISFNLYFVRIEKVKLINYFLILFEYILLLAYFTKVRFTSPVLKRDKLIGSLIQLFIFIIPIVYLALVGLPLSFSTAIKIYPYTYNYIEIYRNFDLLNYSYLNISFIIFAVYSVVPFLIAFFSKKQILLLVLIFLLFLRILLKIIELNPELYDFIFRNEIIYQYYSMYLKLSFNICFSFFLFKKKEFKERRHNDLYNTLQ